jgi:hypothetical protein
VQSTYNEAEGEPGVGLDDGTGVVAAVVAAADEAFVAFHLLTEGVLAAGEDDAHCCGRRAVVGSNYQSPESLVSIVWEWNAQESDAFKTDRQDNAAGAGDRSRLSLLK